MSKPPRKQKPEAVETKPDAWERFERTMDQIVPPKPRMQKQMALHNGDCFVAIDGKMRIAHETARNDDGSITANLYRNLEDYRAGRVMEPSVIYWR